MAEFRHQRHKPVVPLAQPRQLVLACPPMHSKVNLSRIVRALGCCGVTRLIAAGNASFDRKITRGAEDQLTIRKVRTLLPEILRWQRDGYELVGLEQTTNSTCLFDYCFPRKSVLVIGSERRGIDGEILARLDATVEIPVHGMPFSFNAATATVMALYEYCRQYPEG